jgi:hypothetical protein
MANTKRHVLSGILDVPSLPPSFRSFGPEFNDDRKRYGSPHSLDYTDGKILLATYTLRQSHHASLLFMIAEIIVRHFLD